MQDEITVRYGGAAALERVVRVVMVEAMAFNSGRAKVADLMTALASIAAFQFATGRGLRSRD